MKTRVLAEPTLVGREKELEELTRCLDSAFEGKGTTVFVSGEAGSGKTRLTTEFLKRAKQKGVTLLSGWCLSDAAVPYFPFVRALDTYFSTICHEEPSESPKFETPAPPTTGPIGIEGFGITAWLSGVRTPERLGKTGTLSPEIWKDQVFDAVGKTLQSISAQEPLILFIEDIHWADSASLALLHYISRIIGSEKILVLATFRSEELTADAEGHAHPLAEIVRLMKREDLFTEIRLANLDRTTISRVAEIMLNGSIHPEFAETLVRESRGNALYLVESLRMLSEQKQLVQENNEWRLCVDELSIPSKFKDIILRRLGALKFDQRRMLDAASVIGEKFDVELLGAVLGQDNLEVLETLNVISQSTSLVTVEEGFFSFDHAKSREAIYGEIPLPLKRGYHARVAERLEGKTGSLPLSDIAYHYAQSGNEEKAVEYALAAGEDALARFSNAEAIKHFTYVLQNLPEHPDNAEKKRIALEGLGDACYVNGLFTKATEVFERLADSSTGQVKLRAYRKAMDALFFGFGAKGRDHLMELAAKAEPYAASDRMESARIRFHKASALDSLKARAEEFEAALQVFEEEYSLQDVARALEATGAAESLCFEEKGLSKTLLAIAMFEEMGDLRGLARAAHQGDLNFVVFGLLQETLDLRPKTIKTCEKIGDYARLADTSLRSTMALESNGRFAEAISEALKAKGYFERVEGGQQGMIYAALMRLHTKAGNMEAAEENYKKLTKLLQESRLDSARAATFFPRLFSANVAMALGVFSAATGRWEEANHYFEEASVAAEEMGWGLIEVLVKRNYIWALERQGRTDEANSKRAEIQKYYDKVDERFSHIRLDAYLLAPRKVMAGEEFEMRLDLVDVSRKPALLVRVKDLIPPDLVVTSQPANCRLDKGSIELKERSLGPFQVETLKLRLKALKLAAFTLNPAVTYVNELGETKTCEPKPFTITVQPARPTYEVLPGRITTGLEELDANLFGGIPEKYAVALTSPSTDEKELLVKKFLEAGATAGEIVFHITAEAANTKALAEKYPSNFHLFICNPQADAIVQSAPNVFKLKGVENLTDVDIALTKAFRTLAPSAVAPRRICIEIVSDVLLQHHAVNTRKWLSALLPTLKSKGFTILAVVDPHMHPAEELQAILGVFDGEIRVTEKETPEGIRQTLRIRKLLNQKYLENEIVLTKDKMSG